MNEKRFTFGETLFDWGDIDQIVSEKVMSKLETILKTLYDGRFPVRIQRKRIKGWRMPEGSVYVGRSSRWGNPFRVQQENDKYFVVDTRTGEKAEGCAFNERTANARCIALFREYAWQRLAEEPNWLDDLFKKNMVCWCGLEQPCHADGLFDMISQIMVAHHIVDIAKGKETGNE